MNKIEEKNKNQTYLLKDGQKNLYSIYEDLPTLLICVMDTFSTSPLGSLELALTKNNNLPCDSFSACFNINVCLT